MRRGVERLRQVGAGPDRGLDPFGAQRIGLLGRAGGTDDAPVIGQEAGEGTGGIAVAEGEKRLHRVYVPDAGLAVQQREGPFVRTVIEGVEDFGEDGVGAGLRGEESGGASELQRVDAA